MLQPEKSNDLSGKLIWTGRQANMGRLKTKKEEIGS